MGINAEYMGTVGVLPPLPSTINMLLCLALIVLVAAEPEGKSDADAFYGVGGYGVHGVRTYGGLANIGYGIGGIGGYSLSQGVYGKREADSDAYYYGGIGHGIGGYGVHGVRNYGGYGLVGGVYGKREADSDAYYYGGIGHGIGGYGVHGVRNYGVYGIGHGFGYNG